MSRVRGLEKTEIDRPAMRPERVKAREVSIFTHVSSGKEWIVPIMDPALICLTALGFKPPFSFTTGVRASCWYCEKDQSFGLTLDGPESNRTHLRDWKV